MAEPIRLPWLKSYDIRGEVPRELDAGTAYEIGLAYAKVIQPAGAVAVGHDIRLSSPTLSRAVISGLNDGGVDTYDIGQCGTEMVYFACSLPGVGGGIMVTASHNPKNDNGMKMVRWDMKRQVVRPIIRETGLLEMEERIRTGRLRSAGRAGVNGVVDIVPEYVEQVLSFVRDTELEPYRIVVNAGNGSAGPIVDALAPHLPFELVRIGFEPDGHFPHGVPNPMKESSRKATTRAVQWRDAQLGVAWDGDFDRCFLWDEDGTFIEGYYIVGLLAQQMLKQHGGGRVIHDPRLFWNTLDIVESVPGSEAIRSKTGHARIKELMVNSDAVYGGEMSAHHYFRDFVYCDAGMVPWLLVAALMSNTGRCLSDLVAERESKFPCSGEINRRTSSKEAVFAHLEQHYAKQSPAPEADHFDGLSLDFGGQWRFNVRGSDTEPGLVRLNVESRGDRALMEDKTQEVLALIDQAGADAAQ